MWVRTCQKVTFASAWLILLVTIVRHFMLTYMCSITFFSAGVNLLYQKYKKNLAISLIPTHKSMTYEYKMVGQWNTWLPVISKYFRIIFLKENCKNAAQPNKSA